MSRLTITDYECQSLKALATLQDLTDLLAQRISDGLQGKVSGKTIATILDEELGHDRKT